MFRTPFFATPALSELYPRSTSGIVGSVGLQLAACVFGLGFTAPGSLLRPAALPLIGASIWTLGQTCAQVMPWMLASNILGGVVCGWFTQYIVSGLILRENFEDGGPAKPKSKGQEGEKTASPKKHDGSHGMGGFLKRVWFGLNTINSQRNVGTPRQAKNVPSFKTSNSAYIPSRGAFLLRTALKAVGSFLLIDFMTLDTGADTSQHSILFAANKVPLFSRLGSVTREELQLRATVSIGHWIGSYLFMQLIHSTMAFSTVLLGFYEPRGWPPLFGSFSDLWSIRQFWGKFYHQLLRFKLTTLSSFLVDTTLRIPRKTLIHRYSTILAVFFFSGLCHLPADAWGVIPARESGALQFFCMQAAGIMVEDGVQELWRRIRGKNCNDVPGVFERAAGGLWIAVWLTWTTPIWIYPGHMRPVVGEKGLLLPFSILKRFVSL